MKRKGMWQIPPPAEPVTDEYLASVTIGDRKPLNYRIQLAAYDVRWPSMFAAADRKIRSAISTRALLVEHVGSTSVPGLSAKPIIDIVLAVEDSRDEASYVSALEIHGFSLRAREPDWYEHRFLIQKFGDAEWHLHVFSAGCEEIERMLAFRDRLRSDADDRQQYEDTKRRLAARKWKHVQNYADAKSDIVREILRRARQAAVSGR